MTSTQALVAAVVRRLEFALVPRVAAEGLPAVTEFLSYAPPVPQPVKAPQVWVDVRRESRGDLGAFGGANAKQARQRVVLIGVTAAGQDVQVAIDRQRAYADLIVAVMESEQTCGGEALRVQWIDTQYTPNIPLNGVALYREAILTFHLPRWRGLGED